MGKDFALYSINAIYEEIGANTAQALPVFHAFSGCDTTSSFHGKGKRSVWEAWKSFPEVTSAFLFIAENPFKAVDNTSPHFMTLERFTVILYDKTSDCKYSNQSRRELFCKKKQKFRESSSNSRCSCPACKTDYFSEQYIGFVIRPSMHNPKTK